MVVERADVVDDRGGVIAESTSADMETSTEEAAGEDTGHVLDVAGEDTGDVLDVAASPRSGEGAGSVPAHAHSTMVATAAVVAVRRSGIGLTITSALNGIAEVSRARNNGSIDDVIGEWRVLRLIVRESLLNAVGVQDGDIPAVGGVLDR